MFVIMSVLCLFTEGLREDCLYQLSHPPKIKYLLTYLCVRLKSTAINIKERQIKVQGIQKYMYKNGNQQAHIELPVATRHCHDMTGKLLKAALNQNTHTLETHFLQTAMV